MMRRRTTQWGTGSAIALLLAVAASGCSDEAPAGAVELTDVGIGATGAGPLAAGSGCLSSDQCDDGHVCVASDHGAAIGACRAVCDPARPSCEAGTACVSLSATVRGEDALHDGACVPQAGAALRAYSRCGDDDGHCRGGLGCLRIDSARSGGHCLMTCAEDVDCAALGSASRCALDVELSDGSRLGSCVVPCTSAESCASGQRCLSVPGGGVCVE